MVIDDSVVAASFSVIVSFVVHFAAVSVVGSTVGSIVLWVSCFCGFFLLVTWVHPSSGLFGWSPGSRVGLMMVDLFLLLSLILSLLLVFVVVRRCFLWAVSGLTACRTSRVTV